MGRRAFASVLGLLLCLSAFAQRSEEQIRSDIRNLGNIYVCYPDTACTCTKAPRGYKPFYITHLGRHGTRYRSEEKEYAYPLGLLRKADTLGVLTPAGKELLGEFETLAADAEGRWGQLMPKGYEEHRHIIDRMCSNYPEVFKAKKDSPKRVEAWSTDVIRTIHSMAAGMGELGKLYPDLQISMESSKRVVKGWLDRSNAKKVDKKTAYMLADYSANCHYEGFNSRIFTDDSFLEDRKGAVLQATWAMAPTAASCGLGLDFYRFLTVDECYPLWAQRNMYMYLTFGPSEEYGNYTRRDQIPLLRRMIDTADDAIAGSDLCATFHYAHDVHVIPMANLMGIKGCCESAPDLGHVGEAWCDYVITPMTCNIQMVFFRKKGSDDVLVKVMENERECSLGLDTDCWPFYHWSDVKPYFMERMEK